MKHPKLIKILDSKTVEIQAKRSILKWLSCIEQRWIVGMRKSKKSKLTYGLKSLRRDVNLMLKLLKFWWGERQEMVNEYKLLNKSLSLIFEMNVENMYCPN